MKKYKQTLQGNKLNISRSMRPSVATMALVNAIMLTGAAQAQTNTPPVQANSSTNAPVKMQDVVITAEKVQDENSYKPETLSSPKYVVPLRDVPQTVTVIPRAVFQDQGATSLRDVLRNVTGISMQAGEGGTPAGDQMSIRGYSARTDMYVDGVRDFGGYSRDPFNLEQVEVSKGPSSAYGGRGSTGGSINMVSKAPQLAPSYAGSIGFGTDNFKRTTLDLNQPLEGTGFEGVALRLNAMWHDADVPGRDEVYNKRWGLAPSLAIGLGTPTRLTLSYFHMDQDNMPDYGIPWVPGNNVPLAAFANQPAPVDYSNFYGLTARDYEHVQNDMGTALLEHDFNDSVRLRNTFRYGQTVRDSVITAPRFLNTATTTIRRTDMKSRDQVDKIISDQVDLNIDFDTGSVEHALVTGLEFSREEEINFNRTDTNFQPPTDLFNPNPNDPYVGGVTRDGTFTQTKANSFGIYAFDTLKFNEKWQFTGGLRADYFSVDYAPRVGTGNALGRSDTMVSWRSALVFKPRENGSIYFGYGTSFNPSAEGLTLGAGVGNSASVEPEKSQSFELGTKWDLFKERLSVSGALFRTDKTNARTQDPTNPAVITISGEQYVQGIELGASGRITDDWSLFAGYAYMQSEITKSDNPAEQGSKLSNTPQQSFNLWTTYTLPWRMDIGGGAQYVGSRYSSNSSTGRRTAPGYWLMNASLGYEVTKNFNLRLNVYNLADEEYIGSVGGGHFIPGEGRSAVLTANFKF